MLGKITHSSGRRHSKCIITVLQNCPRPIVHLMLILKQVCFRISKELSYPSVPQGDHQKKSTSKTLVHIAFPTVPSELGVRSYPANLLCVYLYVRLPNESLFRLNLNTDHTQSRYIGSPDGSLAVAHYVESCTRADARFCLDRQIIINFYIRLWLKNWMLILPLTQLNSFLPPGCQSLGEGGPASTQVLISGKKDGV